MIKDIFNNWMDLFNEGFIGIILGSVFLLIFLIISYLVFIVIDTAFQDDLRGYGTVQEVRYTPAHTTYIYNSQPNGGTIMTPVFNPDSWDAEIDFKGTTDSTAITEAQFMNLKYGDGIDITYREGRLSGSLYLTSIIPK